MIAFSGVGKHYGTRDVLSDITFRINAQEKIGLIGANGVGKTTLIKLLLGEEEPSEGAVIRRGDIRIGSVPQYAGFAEGQTVQDVLMAKHRLAEEELRREEHRLAEVARGDVEAALARYQEARDDFDRIGGDSLPRRAESVLQSLGLGGRKHQLVSSLSGGEKNVLSLGRALMEEPGLLVLDEPGNHLDYVGLAWLERFLVSFRGAVLIVSHNRYLLDRVVGRVWELENRRLTLYKGNYSHYRMTRLRKLVARQADYAANQKRLAELEALVRRFAEIARSTADPAWGKRLRARRSQLEREKGQAVAKPELDRSAISLEIDHSSSKADIALQINAYERRFGENVLFEDADLEIGCGEKVALVGPNGCGKTTLLKDIVERGSWEDAVLRIGPSMVVGYCAQNQEVFDPDTTILEELQRLGKTDRKQAFAVLSRFLFGWEDMDKRIGSLSGGEKNRLQLARLTVLNANFLILDEPTNHMDIPSKEAIEESLSSFEGTVLLVSHDRYLLDKISSSIVAVGEKKLRRFHGNFSEFWASELSLSRRLDGRVSTRDKQHRAGRGEAQKRRSREDDGRAVELENRITKLEERKLSLEWEVADAFAAGNHVLGRKLSNALEKLSRRLGSLYGEWDEASRS